MGSAWCKNRAADADDSKSAVGRVILRCVNQVCPAQRTDPAAVPAQTTPARKQEDDPEAAFHPWGRTQPVESPPLPERPPPHSTVSSSAWQSAVLTVPGPEPPVPPPRTKRRWRRRHSRGQPLVRSHSLASRRAATAPQQFGLRRAGSVGELSAEAGADNPRFVFDFTSYSTARTPPPSPARDDEDRPAAPQRSRDILRELGLPASLREDDKLGPSRASSGRSSMTPSLSELEAALSDLLEAGVTREDDEEAESVVRPAHYHKAPPLPKEVVA